MIKRHTNFLKYYMIRKTLYVLVLLLITSCFNTLQEKNYISANVDHSKLEDFHQNTGDYGIVIIKISVENKERQNLINNALYSKTIAFRTSWAHENKELKEAQWFKIEGGLLPRKGLLTLVDLVAGISSSDAENQEYRVLLLKPGTYNMYYCGLYNRNRIATKSIHAAKLTTSFNIKGGEILYLGDMVLSMEEMEIMAVKTEKTYAKITVHNKFSEALNFLKNENLYDSLDKESIKVKLLKISSI